MLINFAHANGIPAASYKPLFEQLAPHHVMYNASYGLDPAFPVSNNWVHLADEMIHFVAQNANEPVLGIGHSLGAILTFIAASKRPDLFRGVLMLDPPLIWGRLAWGVKLAKLIGKIDDITPAGKSKHRRSSWPDRDAAIEYFASKKLFQFEPRCFEAFCDSVIEPADKGSVKLSIGVDTEVAIFRTTPDNLKSCTRPTVPIKVIYAKQSDASFARCIEPFCQYFGIERQTIDGQHMYPLQQPDLTVSLIHEFIGGLNHAD